MDIGIGLAVIAGLVVALIVISFFSTWLKALLANAYVGFGTLVAMRLRGVPVGLIVDARITAEKASLPLTTDQLEAHYLAEGNVVQTVQSIIAASKANITLNWDRACAIDLATRGTSKSVLEAVRTSINPKVIDCVIEGRETIDGVAKDGIQVKVRARVTVRSNLDRYVGSAQEETVIARVGESIVSTIGSSENYKVVLENPNSITEKVLDRGLDQGTAFEILSIDIADVDLEKIVELHFVLRKQPQTRRLLRHRLKFAVLPQLHWSRKMWLRYRKCRQNLSKLNLRYLLPWLRHFAVVI